MKTGALKLVATFAVYVLIFAILRMAFIAVHTEIFGSFGLGNLLDAIIHGIPMDCSVAAYLTAFPALIYIVESIIGSKRWTTSTVKIWFAISAILIAFVAVLDCALYTYWGFRLDTTPFFYFATSPSVSLASANFTEIIACLIAFIAIAASIYCLQSRIAGKFNVSAARRPLLSAVGLIVLTALLIIPMRGGVGLAPMNLSRAYFSDNARLNHAAINPMFSIMYASLHQTKDYDRFVFMEESEADNAIHEYLESLESVDSQAIAANDSTLILTHKPNPDILLIILESFSAHLMPSLGGESIAVGLDSVARSGLTFSNFYANSFRTDRALPSILSGFPALPTLSLLKYVDKVEKLPSIATLLKPEGYATSYYYGGDINFANMQAYLKSCDFDKIISENDFPQHLRNSKWGVADGPLFDYVAASMSNQTPTFSVVQTSSSHEPFEVPYQNIKFVDSPEKNAFAYTDSCLTAFLKQFSVTPKWDNTLIFITPDHLGVWPLNLENPGERHHVPFVVTGGALNPSLTGVKLNIPASQNDIAATILNAVGVKSDIMDFSTNILDADRHHIAIFSEPEIAGLISTGDTVIYNITSNKFTGTDNQLARKALKAILQKQYQAAKAL